MTEPRRTRAAGFVVTAVHNASCAALSMAVVAVALVGTGAAVAVSRTSGPSDSLAAAAPDEPAGGSLAAPGAASPSPSPRPTAAATRSTADRREARATLHAALRNALAKRSARAVTHFTTKHGIAVFDNRAAMARGVQRISIYGGHIAIRVVGSTTYYTGDRRGLVRYLTYQPKAAALLGHRWVPLIAGNKGYRVLTQGVTLPSLLRSERLGAPLRVLPQRVIDGVTVTGVQGRGTGGGARKGSPATWWISTGPHPLPVRFEATSPGNHLVQTFRAWGKPVHVRRPHAVFG